MKTEDAARKLAAWRRANLQANALQLLLRLKEEQVADLNHELLKAQGAIQRLDEEVEVLNELSGGGR